MNTNKKPTMSSIIKDEVEAGLNAKQIVAKHGFNLKSTQSYISHLKTGKTPVAKPMVVIDKMKGFLPTQDNKYISRNIYGTTDVKLLTEAYNNRNNMLIIGPTGSGKTHLLRHVADSLHIPYFRVNMTGGWTPDDFAGQFIPNQNPGPDSPKYIWKDGTLVEFMKNGGIFVVDEINMAPADILSMLNSVTDDERKLVLTQKDGEVVIAHKDFCFMATMNPDYEGTKPLNLALKDRFRIVYLDYNDNVEKKLGVDSKFLEMTKKLRTSSEITTPVSTRDLIKYRDDRTKYSENIARAFFVNNFDSTEQAVVTEMMEMILDGKEPDSVVDDKTSGGN